MEPDKAVIFMGMLVAIVAAAVQSFRLGDRGIEMSDLKRDLDSERKWRRDAEQEASKARKDLAVLEEAVRSFADRILGDD